jgi:hypothetical protein
MQHCCTIGLSKLCNSNSISNSSCLRIAYRDANYEECSCSPTPAMALRLRTTAAADAGRRAL